MQPVIQGGMRLDKWLWAARFFKTRQLAAEAVTGGKVHLNGQRTKPGKGVRKGTRLLVHKGSLEWDIEILELSRQRRPASEAAALYRESETSFARRQEVTEARRRLRALDGQLTHGRPTKKDRRKLESFTGRSRRSTVTHGQRDLSQDLPRSQ